MKNHVLTRGQWIDDQLIDPPVFNHRADWFSSGFQLTMTGPETHILHAGWFRSARRGRVSGRDRLCSADHHHREYPGQGPVLEWTELLRQRPVHLALERVDRGMFVVDPAPLAITEIMYHPRPPSGAAEVGLHGLGFRIH